MKFPFPRKSLCKRQETESVNCMFQKEKMSEVFRYVQSCLSTRLIKTEKKRKKKLVSFRPVKLS